MAARGKFFDAMCANGPAIWGGCVTRHSIRAESRYPAPAGPESCHGARRVWRTFCRQGTKFVEHYECRGTSCLEARKLSRYKKFYCVQMRALPTEAERRWVSGCNGYYKFVLGAETKAKSVTNNLPILSVLCGVIILFCYSSF
jgi:hypothetical protein